MLGLLGRKQTLRRKGYIGGHKDPEPDYSSSRPCELGLRISDCSLYSWQRWTLPVLHQTRPGSLTVTTMARVRGKHIIDIPLVSKRIPPNPLFGYDPGTHPAPPSTASAKSSKASLTPSTLAHRILLYDRRCLVTGAVSDQLKPCHLVNTIRARDSSVQQEKRLQKERVVRSIALPELLGDGISLVLGTYPHPAAVWGRGLFLGQFTELYYRWVVFCSARDAETSV